MTPEISDDEITKAARLAAEMQTELGSAQASVQRVMSRFRAMPICDEATADAIDASLTSLAFSVDSVRRALSEASGQDLQPPPGADEPDDCDGPPIRLPRADEK